MTPLQLVQYYANLLIFQYVGLRRAYSTILSTVTPIVMASQSQQTITFLPLPTSGTFVLSYNGINSPSINWNDSASTIQTDLQSIPTLGAVTVSGSISSGLIINFVGISGVANLLTLFSNTLVSSIIPVIITITQTDVTLPIAVQNGFNLNTAVGAQLDVLGKYAGVVRSVNTPTGTITLDDSDFVSLIKFAIVQNTSGSSLADIETNLNTVFPGQFIIVDHKNMTMTYIFSGTLGSPNFFRVLIQEGLIPAPMAVGINIFIPPLAYNFFGFSTYGGLNPSVKPFNTYLDFNKNWIFLSYTDVIPT